MIKKFSRAGNHHNNDITKCQDVIEVNDSGMYSVLTVADGVSSCKQARAGAEIASKSVTELLSRNAEFFQELDREKMVDIILKHINFELERAAGKNNENVEEYSSTITSVLYNKTSGKMLLINLGDSLILSTKKDNFQIVSSPYNSVSGCPVTTSRKAKEYIKVSILDSFDSDSLMICTDGAWRAMFEKNKLKSDVKTMVTDMDYDILDEYLCNQNNEDDYSYVAIKK